MKCGATLKEGERPMSREEKAWEMARAYAKHKAEMMYPDPERRAKEEPRIARAEYMKLMYP